MTIPQLQQFAGPISVPGGRVGDPSLPLTETHVWGTVRDGGDWSACVVRSVLHDPTKRGRRLLVNVSTGDDGFQMDPRGASTASGSPCRVIPDDDGVRIEADQSGWSIVIDGDRFEWQDGDVAAFAGEIVGPPVGWKVDDFVYVHAVAVVSGEVLGRRVDGFVGLDQAHLPAGRTFYVDDPVAQGRWMVGMLSFGNRYRDGSIEVGAVGFGHDGWRYAFVNTPDGTRTMTNDVDGRVLREDGYWPTEVEIEIDGERWVWECPRSGRFTGYGRLENPQSDGRFRRVGDDREIVSWFAQGETVPAHGDRPER